LYTEGEPAESLPEASVALTYGAYEVTDDEADDVADGDVLVCFAGSASVARANRKMTPAVGFRKLRMRMHPLSRDFSFRRGECLTPA
jgi:hypothetical protein